MPLSDMVDAARIPIEGNCAKSSNNVDVKPTDSSMRTDMVCYLAYSEHPNPCNDLTNKTTTMSSVCKPKEGAEACTSPDDPGNTLNDCFTCCKYPCETCESGPKTKFHDFT